jgi:hypothetical protein
MQRQGRWLLVLAAAAIVIVLFVVLRPNNGNNSATTMQSTTTTTAAPAAQTIKITISGGKPVGGITRVTVRQGQTVKLIVHSDVADEVHVHGYDLHKDVTAGGTAEITFEAKIAGEFEAELESRKLQILALTVKP